MGLGLGIPTPFVTALKKDDKKITVPKDDSFDVSHEIEDTKPVPKFNIPKEPERVSFIESSDSDDKSKKN